MNTRIKTILADGWARTAGELAVHIHVSPSSIAKALEGMLADGELVAYHQPVGGTRYGLTGHTEHPTWWSRS